MSLTLNLAWYRNSPARSTKSTRLHSYGALSACKLTVSGSISLPSRGSFHLSLTVLFAIGHVVVFSLLGWSPFLPSGFLVSRRTPDSASLAQYFVYRIVTFFDVPFQTLRLYITILLSRSLPQDHYDLGLGFSDFARHYSRNHFCFLFLRVLRCFSSPGSPCITIYSLCNNMILLMLSSLIRISTGHWIFAPHRSFSQLVTSFFGATYQGILRKPFVAWSLIFIFSSIFLLVSRLMKILLLFTRLILFSLFKCLKIAFNVFYLLLTKLAFLN